jgi:hypothetical protein
MSTSYPSVSFATFPPTLAPSGSVRVDYTDAPVVLPAAANTTATAAQCVNGLFDNTAATGVNTLTTPTAALLVAYLSGCMVGSTFDFSIVGDAGSNLTVAAGVGGTLVGNSSVVSGSSARYRVRLTNVSSGTEAYTLTRVA